MKRLAWLPLALAVLASSAHAWPHRGIVPDLTPVIVPGTTAPASWTATAQPGNQGTPGDFGYTEPAIASWDDIPYQTFSSDHIICVAAFHINASGITGIDHVDFFVNGGSATTISSQQVNISTGKLEWCAKVQPANFPAIAAVTDYLAEARAVVYPVTGVPLILQGAIPGDEESMFFNVNAGGTLPATITYVDASTGVDSGNCPIGSPCLTIHFAKEVINTAQSSDVGGGIIYLKAGSYSYCAATESLIRAAANQYLTISGAPGVDTSTVFINSTSGSSGCRTRKVHLDNLTLSGAGLAVTGLQGGSTTTGPILWAGSGIIYSGPGRTIVNSQSYATTWSAKFIDGGSYQHSENGPVGHFTRNTYTNDIGSDAWQNVHTLIHNTLGTIDPSGTAFHADEYQRSSDGNNVVLYGNTGSISANAQGEYVQTGVNMTDSASVDNTFTIQSGTGFNALQLIGPHVNALFKNDSWPGGGNKLRTDAGFTATDVVFDTSTCTQSLGTVSGVTYRNSATCQ